MRMVFIATALLVAVACGGSGNNPKASGTPTAETPQARPSSTGRITILQPANNETVKGSTVHVKIQLTGAKIVPVTSKNLRPDEGHIHLTLDRKLVTMTAQTQADVVAVTPGTHVLHVEFVASDHFPFDPRIIADVVFTDVA